MPLEFPIEEGAVSNDALLGILEAPGGFRMFVQPIVEITTAKHRVVGYECLARGPAGSELDSSEELFEYVRLCQATTRIDLLCLQLALQTAQKLPWSAQIVVKQHMITLEDEPRFPQLCEGVARSAGIDPSRLTIAISEHSQRVPSLGFERTLGALRDRKIAIALDGVGTGYANYQLMIGCQPNYYRLDRWFVAGIATDAARQAVVMSLLLLASRIGACVMVEGVQDLGDLSALRRLGVELFQGDLFGRAISPEEASDREDVGIARARE